MTELKEKFADLLDEVHDGYVSEGGCLLSGWSRGYSAEGGLHPEVSRGVEEILKGFLDLIDVDELATVICIALDHSGDRECERDRAAAQAVKDWLS